MSVCVCVCMCGRLRYGGVGRHCPKAHMWNMYAYVVRELLVGVTSLLMGSRGLNSVIRLGGNFFACLPALPTQALLFFQFSIMVTGGLFDWCLFYLWAEFPAYPPPPSPKLMARDLAHHWSQHEDLSHLLSWLLVGVQNPTEPGSTGIQSGGLSRKQVHWIVKKSYLRLCLQKDKNKKQ